MFKSVSQKEKEVFAALKDKFGYTNSMQSPVVEKVIVSTGVGSITDKKKLEEISAKIALITGQKPVVRHAKKAISNFKLREGMPVGVSVTLRGQRMYDFFGKLVDVVFPRIRDFRGFTVKSFDGSGNYSIGLNDHTVFPEINLDDIVQTHGLQINIQTTATDNEGAEKLFELYKFPFKETNTVKK